MKSQKGVALTSIIIYIVIMLAVISIIAIFSSFFYNNVDEIGKEVNPSQEFTRFNSFFIKDINKDNISILETGNSNNESYVILSDGIQYTFKNHKIYRGKVKLSESIYEIQFEKIDDTTVNVKYKLTEDSIQEQTKFNT